MIQENIIYIIYLHTKKKHPNYWYIEFTCNNGLFAHLNLLRDLLSKFSSFSQKITNVIRHYVKPIKMDIKSRGCGSVHPHKIYIKKDVPL